MKTKSKKEFGWGFFLIIRLTGFNFSFYNDYKNKLSNKIKNGNTTYNLIDDRWNNLFLAIL